MDTVHCYSRNIVAYIEVNNSIIKYFIDGIS